MIDEVTCLKFLNALMDYSDLFSALRRIYLLATLCVCTFVSFLLYTESFSRFKFVSN